MDYGLIGEKLGHSLSKPVHEKLADYTYQLCPLSKDEFSSFMKKKDFKAINVTIPYKRDVLPCLDSIDRHAASIGAVNTIVNRKGKLYGYNTDYSGFLYMIKHHDIHVPDSKCIVLGNGGAARAILSVLNDEKARELVIVNVRAGKGAISYEECFAKHKDADIVVNTSPVGMYPNIHATPVDLTKFPNCKAVIDIIYNPLETMLSKQGKALGMTAVTGLEMLVAQAKYAVEIFLDERIDDKRIHSIYLELIDSQKTPPIP
ncbi:MAG: shikimate dehydrogenase [Lachnoclostridium sp.]|jgi:shikimate dehydrogenase|nr:shikimate dehydrogenase [Lachnoclostridium sp.]